MSHLKALQSQVFQNKLAHGFNTTDVSLEFLLTYGELAEAYEAWRKKNGEIGEELADVMIYLLGLAEILGIDLDKEVKAKMEKNSKRNYVEKNGVLIKEEE
jgi:NTP pyrophosphatase (non-canonical NTP hydrolase)